MRDEAGTALAAAAVSPMGMAMLQRVADEGLLSPEEDDALRAIQAALAAAGGELPWEAILGSVPPGVLPREHPPTDTASVRLAVNRLRSRRLLRRISDEASRALRSGAVLPDEGSLDAIRRSLVGLEALGTQRLDPWAAAIASEPEVRERLVHTGLAAVDFDQLGWSYGSITAPGGIETGSLLVVGAESGVGKTRFSVETALRSCWLYNIHHRAHRFPVICSVEQTSRNLVANSGLLPGRRWRQALDAQGVDAAFFDTSSLGAGGIESAVGAVVEFVHERAEWARRHHPDQDIRDWLPLVFVFDYAALFARAPLVDGIRHVAQTCRELALGKFWDTQRFPELRHYTCVVILPTQVKRPKVAKEDWLPTRDDIADCRAIADEASLLVLLHRSSQDGSPEWTRGSVRVDKSRSARWTSIWRDTEIYRGTWYSEPEDPGGPPPGKWARRYLESFEQVQRARSSG
jgi:hypothetical protein